MKRVVEKWLKTSPDVIGTAIGNAAREAVRGVFPSNRKKLRHRDIRGKALAAATAAGAGLAALAPVAGRGVSKLASGLEHPVEKVKDAGTDKLKGAGDKLKEEVSGKVKDEVKDFSIPGASLFSKLGGGSDDDDDSGSDSKGGAPGVGKGRRMPVQQAADIGVPCRPSTTSSPSSRTGRSSCTGQSVSQQDETHIAFKTKIWGRTREYTPRSPSSAPTSASMAHHRRGQPHRRGHVPRARPAADARRCQLSTSIGLDDRKMARGMRFVKRAVRADLARFKAHVVMEEEASGEWRGEIEDGDVKSRRSSSGRSSSRSGSSSSRSSGGSSSRRSSGGSSVGPRQRWLVLQPQRQWHVDPAAAPSGASSSRSSGASSSRSSGGW